jgi:hypothetical protein
MKLSSYCILVRPAKTEGCITNSYIQMPECIVSSHVKYIAAFPVTKLYYIFFKRKSKQVVDIYAIISIVLVNCRI